MITKQMLILERSDIAVLKSGSFLTFGLPGGVELELHMEMSRYRINKNGNGKHVGEISNGTGHSKPPRAAYGQKVREFFELFKESNKPLKYSEITSGLGSYRNVSSMISKFIRLGRLKKVDPYRVGPNRYFHYIPTTPPQPSHKAGK